MKQPFKRTLSMLLSVAMIFSMTGMSTVFATEGGEALDSGTITAFAPLAEDVASQGAPQGTAQEDLTLPETLTVTVERTVAEPATPSDAAIGTSDVTDSGEATTVTEDISLPVTWDCAEYDPAAEVGTAFTFAPEWDTDTYPLGEGMEIPAITVTLAEKPVLLGTPRSGDIEINEANFPDKNFRDFLLSTNDHIGSAGADGKLTPAEIANIKSIYVYNKGITDLTGIEHFTELTYLNCGANEMTTLDVRSLTKLETLSCLSGNEGPLETLSVSGLAKLTKLECNGNSLTTLDLSGLTSLKELFCGRNKLTALDFTGITTLTILECGGNQLTSLDMSAMTELKELNCAGNKLTTLTLTGLTKLANLVCNDNKLTGLDVTGLPLGYFQCQNNYMASKAAVTGFDSSKFGTSGFTFDPQFTDSFVPVTDITGLPTEAVVGTPLTLTGTVVPESATNKDLTWIAFYEDGTGAKIEGSTLTATMAGEVSIQAIVEKGMSNSQSFDKLFTVTIKPADGSPTYPVTVTGGYGMPSPTNAGTTVTLELTPGLIPEGKQFKEWEITPADVVFVEGTSKTDQTAKITMPAEAVEAVALYEEIPATVTVTTAADLKTALESTTAAIITVMGDIAMTESIEVKANHTLNIAAGKTVSTGTGNKQITIPTEKTLTLSGTGTLKANNTTVNSYGIYIAGTLTLQSGSNLTAANDGQGTNGIFLNGGKMDGTGATITVENNGQHSTGIGMQSDAAVTLTSGALTVKNKNGTGVSANLTTNGTAITIQGAGDGIAAQTISITGGTVSVANTGNSFGINAISNLNAALTLTGTAVTVSKADANGGGIKVGDGGSLTLENSTVTLENMANTGLNFGSSTTLTMDATSVINLKAGTATGTGLSDLGYATLAITDGAKIKLAQGAQLSRVQNCFSDRGTVCTSDFAITVGAADAAASANGLSAGDYIWNGTHFAKGATSAVSVSDAAELKTELTKTASAIITVTQDIEMTEDIKLGASHTLNIPEGKTVSTGNNTLKIGYTLTLTGTGTLKANGSSVGIQVENGTLKLTSGSKLVAANTGDSTGVSLSTNGRLESSGGTITLQNTGGTGLSFASDTTLVMDAASVINVTAATATATVGGLSRLNADMIATIADGAKINLAPGAKVNKLNGRFNDRGTPHTNTGVVTIGAAGATPSTTGLTAGDYVWDGAAFAKTGVTSGIAIDESNFPDANFRKWLLDANNIGGAGADGVLTTAEIAGITEINVLMLSIADLTGIQHFTALTKLNCSNNRLTALNVSALTKLTTLDCSNNRLTKLENLPTGLTELYCYYNQLTALNVSGLTGLTELYCQVNRLTTLGALPTGLTELTCFSNRLTTLPELPPSLTKLNCQGNQLTKLENLPTGLTELSCANNQLTALNVLGLTSLNFLECSGNRLTELNVTNLPLTDALRCQYNYMPDTSAVTGFTGQWGGNFVFAPQHAPGFVAATDILGLPTEVTVGVPLTLPSTVFPTDATNKTIVWSVRNPGDTGATITGNVLTATAPGTAVIEARITNGKAAGVDFELDFAIPVTAKAPDPNPGPGGGPGGGGGGGSSGGVTVEQDKPTPEQSKPTMNATTEAKATVGTDGKATANVKESDLLAALAAAQKADTAKNGVSVTVKVTTDKTASSIAVTLPQNAINELAKAGVTELRIESDTVNITINLATLAQLSKAKGDVTVSANAVKRDTLSKEAQAAIGNRPVFDLTITAGGKAVTNFDGSVSAAFPYTLAAGENPGNLYGVYVAPNGKVTYLLGSSYDANAKLLRFSSKHFSVFGIGYKADAPKFTDTTGHWAKDSIDFVAARGLLNGTGATTFSPNTGMTRGMFVTALGRLAGIDSTKYKNTKFTDVAADAYYAPYTAWALEKGITSGTTATTFSPDKTITRQELAVFMQNYAKAMGYTIPKIREEVKFADAASISSWAKDAVKAMQMAGVMNGKNENKFDPTGTATRAEVAATLHRYVELVIDVQTAQGLDVNDSGSAMMFENGKAVKSASRTTGSGTYNFNANGEAALLPTKKTGTYTVQRGDSFWLIAKKVGCTMTELEQLNGKSRNDLIYAGMVLKVPVK